MEVHAGAEGKALLFQKGEQSALFLIRLAAAAEQTVARGVERGFQLGFRNLRFAQDHCLALGMGCGDLLDGDLLRMVSQTWLSHMLHAMPSMESVI